MQKPSKTNPRSRFTVSFDVWGMTLTQASAIQASLEAMFENYAILNPIVMQDGEEFETENAKVSFTHATK